MSDNTKVHPQLAKNIESMTEGQRAAVVLCASSFRFGGNWAFIKNSDAEFRVKLDILKTERPHIRAIPVSNGALILADENFLANSVNIAVPNAINGSFVDMANKRRTEECRRFQKFVDNVSKGKSSALKKKDGFYELVIGVFSINDTNNIRVAGNDYPAYKLSLVEALTYLNDLTASGLVVKVRGVTKDGREVFGKVEDIMKSEGLSMLYKGLDIADSGTGVFLTIRIA